MHKWKYLKRIFSHNWTVFCSKLYKGGRNQTKISSSSCSYQDNNEVNCGSSWMTLTFGHIVQILEVMNWEKKSDALFY